MKCIEDLQEDFDFRYKTLQSRGEQRKVSEKTLQKIVQPWLSVRLSDSTDRNSDFMKQEVTRLQDMLNRLDFKRKVGTRGVVLQKK